MSPPASACWPSEKPSRIVQTRPPMRSRASVTVTSAPSMERSRAAARPASPAPATSTVAPPNGRVTSNSQLIDLVALRFEHRDEAIRPDEMGGADDDEGATVSSEQRVEPGQPVAIAADEQALVHHRIVLEVVEYDPFDGGGVAGLPGIGEGQQVGALLIEILERFGQHAILLFHRHPVEERHLVFHCLETLHALAVGPGAIVKVPIKAKAGVEAGP